MPTKPLQMIKATTDKHCAETLGQNWIQLNPFWQREYEAWNDKMKTGLIETMLIPEKRTMNPIWLINHPTDETDCVLDGMHRLTTGILYLDNKFPLVGKHLMELDATKYHGKFYKDLDKVDKDRLKQYEFNMNYLPSTYYTDDEKRRNYYNILNRCSITLNDFEYNRVVYYNFYDKLKVIKQDFEPIFKNKKDTRGAHETELLSLFALCDIPSPTEFGSWSSLKQFYDSWQLKKFKESAKACKNYIEKNEDYIDNTMKLLKNIQNSLKERRFFAECKSHFKTNYLPYKVIISRSAYKFKSMDVFNRYRKRLIKKLNEKLLLKDETCDLVRHLMDDNHKGGKNAQYQKKLIKKVDYIIDSLYDPNNPTNSRCFPRSTKEQVWNNQNQKCNICKKETSIQDCQADHIHNWGSGGMTVFENCQMLCKPCHKDKVSY